MLENDTTFANIERKLKGLASVVMIIGVLGAVLAVLFFFTFEDGDYLLAGLISGAALALVSVITSWFIYAFAELVENTKAIRKKLDA